MSPEQTPRGRILLGLALMLVAFNLRPALSTIGPLLATIRDDTGLGAGGAAILTTLPVLCLGIACALAAPLIRRIGPDLAVLAGSTILAAGLTLRGLGGLGPLFAGTALAAIGIGLDNVLLPALVKRGFAGNSGLMTGLYTMTLCLGAAAGAGAAIPVEHALGGGWPSALAVWSLPALVGAFAWIPFARGTASTAAPSIGRLLRNPLAWWVTGFMGLQSSLAYILFGWLPLLLQGRGLTPLDAGLYASLTTLVQAPGALLVAMLAARARDQRAWIVAIPALTATAFLVLALGADELRIPAACALGFGIGGCFGLGLTLIVLRAADAASAAGLSAMAQGIGYTGASLGPLAFGLAHEATGGWNAPAVLFVGIATAAILIGQAAGRDRKVSAAEREDGSALPATKNPELASGA